MDLRKSTVNAVQVQISERSAKMSEIINTTTETAVPEQRSLPHMENISKAAELFNMTRYAVRVLAEEGKIKAVRIGGRIYVNVDSMRDFFLACTLSPRKRSPSPGNHGEALVRKAC